GHFVLCGLARLGIAGVELDLLADLALGGDAGLADVVEVGDGGAALRADDVADVAQIRREGPGADGGIVAQGRGGVVPGEPLRVVRADAGGDVGVGGELVDVLRLLLAHPGGDGCDGVTGPVLRLVVAEDGGDLRLYLFEGAVAGLAPLQDLDDVVA